MHNDVSRNNIGIKTRFDAGSLIKEGALKLCKNAESPNHHFIWYCALVVNITKTNNKNNNQLILFYKKHSEPGVCGAALPR